MYSVVRTNIFPRGGSIVGAFRLTLFAFLLLRWKRQRYVIFSSSTRNSEKLLRDTPKSCHMKRTECFLDTSVLWQPWFSTIRTKTDEMLPCYEFALGFKTSLAITRIAIDPRQSWWIVDTYSTLTTVILMQCWPELSAWFPFGKCLAKWQKFCRVDTCVLPVCRNLQRGGRTDREKKILVSGRSSVQRSSFSTFLQFQFKRKFQKYNTCCRFRKHTILPTICQAWIFCYSAIACFKSVKEHFWDDKEHQFAKTSTPKNGSISKGVFLRC